MKKHRKKEGFTLIELLAVIVILSILILLAMPSVLRIMENARKNAWNAEVKSYIKAAQMAFTETTIANPQVTDILFDSVETSTNCSPDQKACSRKLDIEGGTAISYLINVWYSSTGEVWYNFEIVGPSYKTMACNKTQCSISDYNKPFEAHGHVTDPLKQFSTFNR